MTLQPGTRLGHYEIAAILGSGGMGEVYRARDDRLDRDVAIKVLPPHLANDAEALGRFQREAKAVAALTHPNIRSIFDFGSEGDLPYAVAELLHGSTLRTIMQAGPLPIARCVEIAGAVADGLAAAHAKGIIHRDVKPENIFITDDGQVKILDFGLARTDVARDEPTFSIHTQPGMAVGTVGYMAPEQIRGRQAGPAADVFSLGCVLYEMLTGQGPFAADTHAETTAAVLRDVPAPPNELRSEVPEELAGTVMRCLAKDPSHRFASAADVAIALRTPQPLPQTTPSTRTTAVTRVPRRFTLGASIAAVVAIVIVIIAEIVTQRSRVIDSGYALRAADVTATSQALRLLGDALRADAQGNRAQASEMLEEAARLDASAPLPPAFLASFTEVAGNHAAASRWANEALHALRDGSPPYEALLVRYLVGPALGDTRSPVGQIASLLQLRPTAWRVRLALAHLRLSRRELAAALHELQQIDVAKLDDRRVALVIADRASLGDIGGAETALTQSALLPGGATALYANGRIAWSKGDARAAATIFDRCIERATIQNVPDIALEARLLSGIARIAEGRFGDAVTQLEITAVTAHDAQRSRDEFAAHVLAAYAADRNGDADARERELVAAAALSDDAPQESVVTMHDLALRMRSPAAASFAAPRVTSGNWSTLGATSLLAARAAQIAGDTTRAAKLLADARAQGIDSTFLAEDAALLAADLGAPRASFRPDPPYPNLVRFVAVFELMRD